MKMFRNLVPDVWLMLVVAASLLFAGAAFGQGASICPGQAESTADFDGDGFADYDECLPLFMLDNLEVEVIGADGAIGFSDTLPTCFGQENPDRRYCASAEQSDLFMIVVPASPSALPPGPIEVATRPISQGGLGLNLHLLTETGDPGDRTVSAISDQKAIRITESLNPTGEVLGQANYGTPNNIDRATIWTSRISSFVAANCSVDCETNTGAFGIGAVTDALARWVIEHEVGHMFQLSATYEKRFGGYHLKAGTDSMMAQFVSFSTSKKTGVTTFFIPTTFDPQSQADAKLIVQ